MVEFGTYNHADALDRLVEIDPKKKCLEFLAERVISNNYRGLHLSQHNRYTFENLLIILENIERVVGEKKMQIRNTDLSQRPQNTPGEESYAKFCNLVQNAMGRGTQDSIRKNFFLDMHRMRLIDRWDKDEEFLPPSFGAQRALYISLTKESLELLSQNESVDKRLKFSKILNDFTSNMLETLRSLVVEHELEYISVYEYMYFVSYIGFETENNNHTYTKSDIAKFIQEFRELGQIERRGVTLCLQTYADPDVFEIGSFWDKTDKRDFHNWKNEAQQSLMLMGLTVYFESIDNKYLRPRFGPSGVYQNERDFTRSLQIKRDYWDKHNIPKTGNFELHHVVPLLYAKTLFEHNELDCWENLIYLERDAHAQITYSNNRHIKLGIDKTSYDVDFTDPIQKDIIDCKKEDALFDPSLSDLMLKKNKELLKI